MTKVTLGRTGITANKNGFGALPIQRISQDVPGNAGFRCRTESLRGHASECLHSLLLC